MESIRRLLFPADAWERARQERVKRDAGRLDSVSPGWARKVDVSTLDMNSVTGPNRCLLCQVFGEYQTGLRALRHSPLGDHTFTAGYLKSWLHEINSRLEADLSPVVLTKGDKQSEADKFLERTNEIINQPKEAEYVCKY